MSFVPQNVFVNQRKHQTMVFMGNKNVQYSLGLEHKMVELTISQCCCLLIIIDSVYHKLCTSYINIHNSSSVSFQYIDIYICQTLRI